MGDACLWKKSGRPSESKDKPRCSLAEYYLSHLKTASFIMKSVYIPLKSIYFDSECDGFDLNIIYSLNKNRRWEIEESIGADILNHLSKLNNRRNTAAIERVSLKNYSRCACISGYCPLRFEEFYPIRTIHYLNEESEYYQKSVDSVTGQTYGNVMGRGKKNDEEDGKDQKEKEDHVVVIYNLMRAPTNYLKLLKKEFQSSNYGGGYDWPRAGYWKRLEREKERKRELRFEDFYYLDTEYDIEDEDEEDLLETKSKYYNFDDHFVENIYIHKPDFPPLEIEPDDYWKLDDPEKDDDTIYSFSIDIQDSEVSKFKKQLELEQFLPTLYDKEYDEYLNELRKVLIGFEWKQHQHFLNTFKQYRTEIEGLKIHFLRVSTPPKEKKTRIVPLLILHGFPGSFWDFFKIIPILTNPSRHGFDFGVKESIQFEVIVPSLPGFLFSEKPEKQGFDAISTARILGKLMYRLDLNNYFVHGTEGYGSDVATLLASLYPGRIAGLHVSNPFVRPTFSTFTLAKYALKAMKQNEENEEEEEEKYTDMADYFKQDKFTYPTNSQAFGSAFANSPTGTSKYIESRWKQLSTYSADINLNELFTLDEIATEIYLYWLTKTLPSALNILDNSYNFETVWLSSQVRIPTAITYSRQSPWRCSKDILEDRYLNLTRVTELPKGGLFHHLQDGHKIAEDIFSFVELQLLHEK